MIARRLSCALLIALFCATAHAAAPVLDYLYPAGGQRGSTITVTAGGKFETWPVQAWADSSEIHIDPASANGTFTFKIGENVQTGPHLIRLHNADGASALRIFMVGQQREMTETEPNDELTKVKTIQALPVTINGVLEKPGDVDAFLIHLDAGQCLVASVIGRRLGAPMDPMLHLFDGAGNELAFAHDGFGLDPLLVYRARLSGNYIIRISGFAFPPAADVKLTGAKSDIYRLSLTTGPFTRATFPAGIRRGEKKPLELLNLCLPGEKSTIEVDATKVRPTQDHLFIPTSDGEGRLRVEVGGGPEFMEDSVSANTPLSPPFAINGRISSSGEDRFEFTAKKSEKLILSLRAGTLGSSLDALLRLEDSAQKELLRNDDSIGDGDLRVEWSPPADGKYRAMISDMKRQGSQDAIYRFSVEKAMPSIAATVAGHEFKVMAGKTVAIKANINRLNGHTGGILITGTDLPPAITSSSGAVGDKGGEVTITLSAGADAKAASVPIRLMMLGTDPDSPFARGASFDLTKEAAQQLIPSTESVWLTVQPLPPATQPSTKPATQPAKAK
ncbi:MAG TPA: PPC domain-containing protein [Tepidisphaeraceae bacterium]|nr:PPC domain-containing protein [Tepidisphaeraceae bacterium]